MVSFINADSASMTNFTGLKSNDIIIIYNCDYEVAGVVDILTYGDCDITLSFILYSLSYKQKNINILPHNIKVKFDGSSFNMVIAELFGIIYNQL